MACLVDNEGPCSIAKLKGQIWFFWNRTRVTIFSKLLAALTLTKSLLFTYLTKAKIKRRFSPLEKKTLKNLTNLTKKINVSLIPCMEVKKIVADGS
jgi:hypothetical protein